MKSISFDNAINQNIHSRFLEMKYKEGKFTIDSYTGLVNLCHLRIDTFFEYFIRENRIVEKFINDHRFYDIYPQENALDIYIRVNNTFKLLRSSKNEDPTIKGIYVNYFILKYYFKWLNEKSKYEITEELINGNKAPYITEKNNILSLPSELDELVKFINFKMQILFNLYNPSIIIDPSMFDPKLDIKIEKKHPFSFYKKINYELNGGVRLPFYLDHAIQEKKEDIIEDAAFISDDSTIYEMP